MEAAFLIAKDLSPDEKVAFQSQYTVRKKSVAIGVLLACTGIFCGLPGLHKFYIGEIKTGIIYLVGTVVSVILTIALIGFLGLIIFWVLCVVDAFNMGPAIACCNEKIAREIKAEIEFMKV
jgi:TM2 domain-containing membrane protein YozV